MNAPHDLDRQLIAWLEDGPSSSPERPIDTALAHARAHPRRRDPLAFIRKDPMSSQNPAASFRSLPLVAVLGLILVAAVAIAVAGGLFERRPAVVPPPVATASPSTAPTATPSPPATVGVSEFHVDLIENVGADASIDIGDLSGTLVSATSGQPADGASVPDGTIAMTGLPGSPDVLVVTWSGSPCDTTHGMAIAADGRTIDIERPTCSGDAIGVDHVVQLTFDHPVDPSRFSGKVTTLR